ncbi:hypothetical protein BP6252_10219 [Coleophoma cylindrospora]|uniref:Uncharacterized protein n=1 Tax=Coleophoma cylindrospora TaxID=1849047 RepID=A0A3D8QYF7_9HELO|nr:hypothetical protein BP6252_10219 [Coleophoma cylindrospora]
MKGNPQLSSTLPYHIHLTIWRGEEDSGTRPCIFRWSPTLDGFSPSGFILRHHTSSGCLEEIPIDHSGLVKLPESDTLVVNGHNQFLWELRPGGKVSFMATLPERYQRLLVPNEGYDLTWPGARVEMWDWGTIRSHLNQVLPTLSNEGARPSLPIPGGSQISFMALLEPTPWPGRALRVARVGFALANIEEEQWRLEQQRPRAPSPQPISPSERVLGAPVLSVMLESSSRVMQCEIVDVILKVLYENRPESGSEDSAARPITFRTFAFEVIQGFLAGPQLQRRRVIGSDTMWEHCEPEDHCWLAIYDDPDISVHVGKDNNFVSLHPGEVWAKTCRVQLPDDVAVGDVFRFRWTGGMVDWWDWGSREEEHAQTVVKLPCWIMGKVTDPADNDGRPKLVVPASNFVEFTIVE